VSALLIGRSHVGAVTRREDLIPAYARGRVCAEPGCETHLSIYNPSPFCALHAVKGDAATRRAASRSPLEERVCGNCGGLFTTNNPRRRYCSDACRMKAWARRREGHRLRLAAAVSLISKVALFTNLAAEIVYVHLGQRVLPAMPSAIASTHSRS
jgi:hypothetical protein